MKPWLRLADIIDACNRRLAYFAAGLTLLMVLFGAYNAVARYLGKFLGAALTSNALVEAQWYLFSLVFLLAAPWALRVGAHVQVDVLYGGLKPRKKAWIDLLGTLFLVLPFVALSLYTCVEFAHLSFLAREESNDPGGLARWPLKAVVPLAFAALLLQGLAQVIRQVAFLLGLGADPHAPQLDGGSQH
ncbi:MAG: TRAP transporter small permease subunit [Planctomycetota bacterium]|nr:TRAP transporter small permease subunit [Planctomycetota bacterium]